VGIPILRLRASPVPKYPSVAREGGEYGRGGTYSLDRDGKSYAPLSVQILLSLRCCPESKQPSISAEWGRRVMSSKEYREFADECMHWAKTARSDRESASSYKWSRLGCKPPISQNAVNGGEAPAAIQQNPEGGWAMPFVRCTPGKVALFSSIFSLAGHATLCDHVVGANRPGPRAGL
jgi:hypothetical protein